MRQITNQTKTRFSWLQSYGLAFTLLICASHIQAQTTKIDFNRSGKNWVAIGYEAFSVSSISSGNSLTFTSETNISVSISHGSVNINGRTITSQADKIKGDNNGNATSESQYLIIDGICPCMDNDIYAIKNENGDIIVGNGRTTEMVAINLKLSGLTQGAHSLRAYHNFLKNYDSYTLPTIAVAVNGTTVLNGIEQSTGTLDLSEVNYSLVNFEVSSPSEEVTITYYSEVESGVTYTTTYFYINSLEIDPIADPQYQAQNPSPANMDYHAEVDNGSVTLTWTAAEGATLHRIYFGNSESQVRNATDWVEETENTSHTRNGLDPLQTYYWRVDEVIGGQVYRGEVWSFKARHLAFPGAEGAGKYAIGGRGGDVYHVTNLNDSGEGSLRYGIENATGPRTIVFDVSGVIQLQTNLVCSKPYITVAGQTAPGKGIMIRDRNYGSTGNDVITRFLRFRYGHGDDWDGTTINPNIGGAAGIKGSHAIMDHCLLGWGSDETLSTRDAYNITFQHSIIGESLNKNGHENKNNPNDLSVEHGYAASIGGEVGSFHHNLLAHNEGRNWSLAGQLDGNNYFKGEMNIYNNVCYNWRNRGTDGGAKEVNFVGNYYKKGPATKQKIIFSADHEDDFPGHQQYFLSENLRADIDGGNKIYDIKRNGTTRTTDNVNEVYRTTISKAIVNNPINYETFLDEPFSFYSLDANNVESAEAAYKNVLSDVGCNYAELDVNEKRLIKETFDGTYSKIGGRTGEPGLIDKESDSEGWAVLAQDIISEIRDADWDTDGDGIPNWFETAKGWSTDGLNNNHTNQDQDFYTDLEIYLNWMAEPHWIKQVINIPIEIDLKDYFAGYTNTSNTTTYTIGTTTGLTTNLSNFTLTVTPTNTGLLSLEVTATETVGTETVSLTRTFNFHVASSEETYNEATVTTVEQTFTLSTQTNNSTANADDIWRFNNGFEIRNNKGKEYSTGLDNCIKFSANIPFTIAIPEGLSVTEITFYGYDNYNGEDSYLSQLGNTTYSSTDYVFPQKSTNGTRYPVTHTISLSTPVKNSLIFQFGGKQTVVKITLKCVRSGSISITLKETATVFLPFKNGSKTVFTSGDLPIRSANVTLERTLSSEYWNTLCLPFDVSGEQIAEVFGEDTKVSEFSSAENKTINFSSVENIRAGVPCVIKPRNTVENPVFEGVNLTSSSPMSTSNGSYHYVGHYVCYDMKTDQTEYFLNTRGTLNYPANDSQNHLKGLRATFTLPAPSLSSLMSFRVFFDEDMVSEGLDIVDGIDAISGLTNIFPVYNLNGQLVGTTKDSLTKGIYIVNGKKTIIK